MARPPVPGAGAVVAGVVGWLVAAAALGGLVYVLHLGRSRPRALAASAEAAAAAVQGRVRARLEVLESERGELGRAIEAEVEQQTKLWQALSLQEPALRDLSAAREEKRREVARLEAAARAAGENLELYGEGVAELRARAAALDRRRQDQIRRYTEKYRAIQALYDAKVQERNPELLRQFYQKHAHTPFGPAALFFTAEKLYEGKRSVDAERLYAQLLTRYPDCGYVSHAQQRLTDIKARLSFEKLEGVGLIPYRALEVNRPAVDAPVAP
jgi:TolA-binding protein